MDNSQLSPVQAPQSVPQQVQPVPVVQEPLTQVPNQMTEPVVQSPVMPQVSGQAIAQQQYMSGPHKEMGPVMQAPVSEYMRPTEVTPHIPQEVAEAGVEVSPNPEQVQLDQTHQQVGITHAKEATPVSIPTQPTVQLPYSSEDAKVVAKKTGTAESRHWLAVLTTYLLKKLQLVTA